MKATSVIALSMILSATLSDRCLGAGDTLAERLGYKATDRLLIVNGDDSGMCHTANLATQEALLKGLMTTTTIMVPCPWFNEMAEFARQHPEKDFGVHLCHTSEWGKYRWGPVTAKDQVAGLVDAEGCLWKSVEQVYSHAKPEEAVIEGRAQIQKALKAGIDLTHLDSHMGTMQLDPRYLEGYVKLAVEFNLPLRMASQELFEKMGFPKTRAQIASQGIVFPDHFIYEELAGEARDVKGFWMGVVQQLKPGVTELYIHAGQPTEEMKAITGSWSVRSQEFELFTHDPDFRQLIQKEGIILVGYKPLRDLQRKAAKNR